ncbi:hypothetical protein LINPERPRIM_LOCUS13732, partial [Linum perenne]
IADQNPSSSHFSLNFLLHSINPSSTLEQGANWSKELGLKPTTLGRGACKKRIAMEPLVTFSLSFSCVPLAMCG